MFENRAPIVIALLLLFFLVSTSAGFANISAVQDSLRSVQLKLIQEKIKLLQQGIIDAGKQQVKERAAGDEKRTAASALIKAEPNREELAGTLERQITTLQSVIGSLRPRAIEEETARIEKRIGEIKEKVKTASGVVLRDLQDELNGLLAEYNALQDDVRSALAESITYRQALVIQEQVRAVQAKVQVLPRAQAAEIAPTKSTVATDAAVKGIEDQVEKLRLKIIQAQIKAIQEKISTLNK